MNDRPDKTHYFDSSPGSKVSSREFSVDTGDRTLVVTTSSGVFSSRGLDKGTAVLLDTVRRHPVAPPPDGSQLCDLGSGSGALAMVLAARHPTCTVHAVDVNERARQLCALNAERNGLHNVVVQAPDDVDPSTRFHVILSNPPIRIGKPALHALLRHWLARLDDDGHADLVVAKNLGSDSLTEWITQIGNDVVRLGSSKGFRVLRVRRHTVQ